MNSFISFFRKAKGFSYAALFIIGIEIVVGFAPFMDYLDPTGVYYTTLKRSVAETKNDYDYIMLGDSRSLSIFGKHSKDGSPSFYNFSLPAAGTRYLPYFIDKYLTANERPKAILFAIDPEQYKPSQVQAFHVDPKIWTLFKHRLLNLFSLRENMEQYEGKEAYFIFKEALPNLIPTVRHREGLEKMLTGMKPKDILNGDYPYYKSNIRLRDLTEETYGQVNLGTYLEIPDGITMDMIQKIVNDSIPGLNKTKSDMSSLDVFLDYAESKNIPIILLEIPHAEGLPQTSFYQEVRAGFKDRAKTRSHVHYLEFPGLSYPIDHFTEGIHFNEKGEERVNKEFNQVIWPKVLELNKP